MESYFAIIDYNLYLDVHPENRDILMKYNNENQKLEQLVNDYEKNYGPLCVTKGGYDEYKWLESPWPWERDGGMYV